jgi:hypothetical protein
MMSALPAAAASIYRPGTPPQMRPDTAVLVSSTSRTTPLRTIRRDLRIDLFGRSLLGKGVRNRDLDGRHGRLLRRYHRFLTGKRGGMDTSPLPARPSRDDPTVTMWEFLNTDRWTMLGKAPRGRRDVVVPLHRTPKYELTSRLRWRWIAVGKPGKGSIGWLAR